MYNLVEDVTSRMMGMSLTMQEKRVVVQGRAGTGKSFVLDMMSKIVRHRFGNDSVVVAAPTDEAAMVVGGRNLFTLFHISSKGIRFEALRGEFENHFRELHKNLKFIFIDEMSAIGSNTLYMIDQRCRQIFPNINEPFGGITVYLFGDFLKLSPTNDEPIYSTKLTAGRKLFDTFQIFKHFTQSMRHSGYDAKEFAGLLERLAIGI